MRKRFKKRQSGVALITAILVTALVAIAAVTLAARQHIDIRRTGNVMATEQAYLYNLGIESVAKALLELYKQENDFDDPEQLFQDYTFPVDGGMVSGSLEDLQSRFNVNSLLETSEDKNGQINQKRNEFTPKQFTCILGKVMESLDLNASRAPELVNAVLDWIDIDSDISFGGGAEDSEYLSLEIPYRPGNQKMTSASELLLVQGFDRVLLYGTKKEDETIPGLLEYVTVLPHEQNTINVNTAQPLILECLSDKLEANDMDELMSDRPYEKTDDFVENAKGLFDEKDKRRDEIVSDLTSLTVKSQFYLVTSTAQVGSNYSKLNSMIQINNNQAATVWRAQATNGI